MGQYLLTTIEDRVGKITFNTPENLNALTPDVMKEFMAVLDEYEENPDVRVVLITGAGRAFSAGGSYDFLKEMFDATPTQIKNTVYKYFAGGVKRLKLFPKPTVAAVNGPAAGAGCEAAIACDFRVVCKEALFSEVWAKLGLICPLGGMFLLHRLVGLAKATEMLMLGTPVAGEEAVKIGLANELVEKENLQDAAMKLALRLAEGAPLALSTIKEGLRRGMESTLAAEWEYNVFAQATLISSEDYKEGANAVMEKRSPNFKGQ